MSDRQITVGTKLVFEGGYWLVDSCSFDGVRGLRIGVRPKLCDKLAETASMSDQSEGTSPRFRIICAGILKDGRACNVTLAVRVAGLIIVKRHGIEVVAERVHSLRCEHCHSYTYIEPSSPVAPAAELPA